MTMRSCADRIMNIKLAPGRRLSCKPRSDISHSPDHVSYGPGRACAIEHVKAQYRKTGSVRVAYSYCSFSTLVSQSPVNILSAFLVQLSEGIPSLYQELSATYKSLSQQQTESNVKLGQLKDIFRRHTAGLDRIFIFVDAINESQSSDQVEEMLSDLAKSCQNVRLVLSSTYSVKQSRIDANVIFRESPMATKTVGRDIRIYVDSQIAGTATLSALSSALRQEIREAILDRSDGV